MTHEEQVKEHETRYERTRPKVKDYEGPKALQLYRQDLEEWAMAYHMTKPNPPGYYRANND